MVLSAQGPLQHGLFMSHYGGFAVRQRAQMSSFYAKADSLSTDECSRNFELWAESAIL